MQYLVSTYGSVVNNKKKTYTIKASSEEEANKIAKSKFNEEYCVVNDDVIVKTSARTKNSIFSFIFLLVPIVLSFVDWKNGHNTISISPDLISCVYAAIFYGSFVVRSKGIQRTFESWIDIVFCILLVFLLSSYVKAILVTKTISIFGIKVLSVNTNIFLIGAMILSWLGLKVVGILSIMVVIVCAFINICSLNEAMGLYGALYIICTLVGVLLYLYVEPVVVEAFYKYKTIIKVGKDNMRKDLLEAGNKVSGLAENIKADTLFDKISTKEKQQIDNVNEEK